MIRFILLSLCLASCGFAAFTEFYVQTTGSNLNAGSTSSDTASVTSINGDWGNAAANTFTAASGTPFSSVTAGVDYASIYLDGASTTGYVARVASVGGGGASVTLSTTIIAGSAPASGATGRTCKIGGAWAGVAGSVDLPFGFVASSLSGTSITPVRVSWKDGTYTATDSISHGNDTIFFEGYLTTPGDNGAKPIIRGPVSGTALNLFDGTGMDNCSFENFIFENNGTTGTSGDSLFYCNSGNFIRQCIFRNANETGSFNQLEVIMVECEAYNNSLSASSDTQAGLKVNISGSLALRCTTHDNNRTGFMADGGLMVYRLISYDNTRAGLGSTGNENQFCMNSDFYNNGLSGAHLGLGSELMMNTNYFNSNFTRNDRYGFESEGQPTPGMFFHNGFGSGTEVNTLGTYEHDKWHIPLNLVTYTSNEPPFGNAPAGNFNIAGAGARGTGYAFWLQLHPSYSGTTGSIDRGASQQ